MKILILAAALLAASQAFADPKTWIVRSEAGANIGSIYTTQQSAVDAAIAAANAQPNKKFLVFGVEKIVVLPTSTISITDPDPVNDPQNPQDPQDPQNP